MPPTTPAQSASLAQADGPPELAAPLMWPPLILWTHVPLLVRVRDLLLTLLAWLVYVVILRKPIVNLVTWISPSVGSWLKEVVTIDYALDTTPYLWIASGLVLWLVLSGVRRRGDLRRLPSADQHLQPLAADAQFEAAGVPLAQQGDWRNARGLRVRHDRDGQIAGATVMTATEQDPFMGESNVRTSRTFCADSRTDSL
ncbi:hypothetical protein WKW77_32860 [Variovorax ureilyticus]|uniref:Poly-beta-1,6-N-acetyl-D-glucosamine biosynthesis protein PgaD n=1 Tax=Variovorax ureilyticus TaxID=1836198 RepID=A0ABU8VQP3_9BURK